MWARSSEGSKTPLDVGQVANGRLAHPGEVDRYVVTLKEGQSIAKGQELGKMGSTDTDQVKLHFEIRSLGKPVDPLRYLPKS